MQHLQQVMQPVPPTAETLRAREMVVSRWLAAAGLLGLVLVVLAHMMRMTRAAILNVMQSAYIETAELKGLGPMRVIWQHALPNAIAPIVSVVVINLAYLVVGVVVVEVVFARPGVGLTFVEALRAHTGMSYDDAKKRAIEVLELVRIHDMTAWVKRATGRKPAVPRWNGGKMPLSTTLADAVVAQLARVQTGDFDDPELQAARPLLPLRCRVLRNATRRQREKSLAQPLRQPLLPSLLQLPPKKPLVPVWSWSRSTPGLICLWPCVLRLSCLRPRRPRLRRKESRPQRCGAA